MTKRKYLTTTIKKAQKYYNTNYSKAKNNKDERIEQLKKSLNEEQLYQLFWGKKRLLTDEVVYKTVNEGVYSCTADTIKEKTKTGKNTLSEFNKSLFSSGQFIVARYRTFTCNCKGLVYIDTKHKDFYNVMKDLFNMDKYETDKYLGEIKNDDNKKGNDNGNNKGIQENAENVDMTAIEATKTESNYSYQNNSNILNNNTYSNSNGSKENEGNKKPKGNDKFNTLRNTIKGLLEKYNFPKAMLNKFASIAGRIKRDFKDKLEESLIDSLIVKAFRVLATSQYNNPKAFYSGTLRNMLNNELNPVKRLTKPSNSQIQASETTSVIEQQEKIMKAKIAKAPKNSMVEQNKAQYKAKETAPKNYYEAKRLEIMKKLGME